MSKLRLKAQSPKVAQLGFKPKTVCLQNLFLTTISFAQKEILFYRKEGDIESEVSKILENF